MLWIFLIILFLLLLVFLIGSILFHIVCGRDLSPLIQKVILTGMENAPELPSECSAGEQFWKLAGKQAVTVTSYDGLKLFGEYYTQSDAERTILLAHGYRSSGLGDFGAALPELAEMKCNILLIDQRACGKSEGRYICFGMKERYDVQTWCRWLTEEAGCRLPIFLDGISLGCSTVLMASDLELPAQVSGIIADCGYTGMKDIMTSVVSNLFHLPAGLIIPLLDLFVKMKVGMPMDAVSTLDCVAATSLPILFAHGEADHFVPVEMGKANYAACRSQKRLLLSPNAAHGMSWLESRTEYNQMIEELFALGNRKGIQEDSYDI